MDNYTTLQSLHERGVHLVLCDGKVAVTKNWQKKRAVPSARPGTQTKRRGAGVHTRRVWLVGSGR